MWSKEKSLFLSLVLTKAAIVCVALCCIFAPYLIGLYDRIQMLSGFDSVYVPLIITVYLSAVISFVALFTLDRLMTNIRKGSIFVNANVKILRLLSYCCFAVSIVFFAFSYFKLVAMLIAVVAAFFGLTLRVLKNVFVQAIEIREENDYTI